MRILDTKSVSPGEKLAKTLYYSDGRVLLEKGMTLSKRYLTKLLELGIEQIYIEDSRYLLKQQETEEAIDEQVKLQTITNIKTVFTRIKTNKEINVEQFKIGVEKMMNSISTAKNVLLNCLETWPSKEYIYPHSVNVAVLSLLVASKLGFNLEKRKNLAVGALLHDVGLLRDRDTSKQSLLMEDENHVWLGFETVRKMQEFSIHSAHICLQHHERIDGSGYPRGLKNKEISSLGRIVSIADTYDCLANIYNMLPHQAFEVIYALCVNALDFELVSELRKVIALYPNGLEVELNTGERGVVVKQNPQVPTRPVVRCYDKEEYVDYDLTKHLTIFITRVKNKPINQYQDLLCLPL